MTDNNDGSYTSTAVNSTEETVTISARVNDIDVLNTADVIFITTNSCNAPIELMVSDIKDTSVDLDWSIPDNSLVEGFQWDIFEIGDNPFVDTPFLSGTTEAGVTKLDNVGVLIENTAYEFYVRTICSDIVLSPFSEAVQFITLAENNDCDNDGIPNNLDTDSCDVIPAEALSPNGDGVNDTWVIIGLNRFPNNVVSVYNRYGHEVFKAKDYQNDWGGFYKQNSEKLPPGSYFFTIELGDASLPIQGWLFINY